MGEAEPRRRAEYEDLEETEVIVVIPLHLSQILVIDLRESLKSCPHAKLFPISQLISDKSIAKFAKSLTRNLKQTRNENLFTMSTTIFQHGSLDNLIDIVACEIANKLNAARPDALPVQEGSAYINAFFGPMRSLLSDLEWEKISKMVEKRVNSQVLTEIQEAVDQQLKEEGKLFQEVEDFSRKMAITGEDHLTLWQRSQDN